MTDVRLTATNPEDSSVVPVACNAKGELLLEETPGFDGNVDGDLTVSGSASFGSASFAGNVTIGVSPNSSTESGVRIGTSGSILINRIDDSGAVAFSIREKGSAGTNINMQSSGAAEFAGDVVVGSRGKKWMIVESNGLAHLVEQSEVSVMDDAAKYPELRNIPEELDLIEKALGDVMEKLRMNPPAGWPVWDGSDEI